MKLYCDYCGTQIDIEHYTACPSCGASFGHDKELKDLKELNNIEAQKQQLEYDRMQLEQEKKQNDTNKKKTATNAVLVNVLAFFAFFGLLFFGIFAAAMAESANETGRKYAAHTTRAAEQTTRAPRITYSINIDIPEIKVQDISIPDIP
ncbi:MAG: hypothetical protein J6X60_05090 [Ruminiclostridium sp.]|nr:hypothetical protein [Ruminiclostridium sp.]